MQQTLVCGESMKETYMYFANGETKSIEGFCPSALECKQEIRQKMKGQKLNWDKDVIIMKTQ